MIQTLCIRVAFRVQADDRIRRLHSLSSKFTSLHDMLHSFLAFSMLLACTEQSHEGSSEKGGGGGVRAKPDH